jgi:hypothetical protein
MKGIEKVFTLKIVSLLVAILFFLNSTAYSIGTSYITHLRKPLDFDLDNKKGISVVNRLKTFLKIFSSGSREDSEMEDTTSTISGRTVIVEKYTDVEKLRRKVKAAMAERKMEGIFSDIHVATKKNRVVIKLKVSSEYATNEKLLRLLESILEILLSNKSHKKNIVKEFKGGISKPGESQIRIYEEEIRKMLSELSPLPKYIVDFYLADDARNLKEYVDYNLWSDYMVAVTHSLYEHETLDGAFLAGYLKKVYDFETKNKIREAKEALDDLTGFSKFFGCVGYGRLKYYDRRNKKLVFAEDVLISEVNPDTLARVDSITEDILRYSRENPDIVYIQNSCYEGRVGRGLGKGRKFINFAYHGKKYLIYQSLSHSQLNTPVWNSLEAVRQNESGGEWYCKPLTEVANQLSPEFTKRLDKFIKHVKIIEDRKEHYIKQLIEEMGLVVDVEGRFLSPPAGLENYDSLEVDKRRYMSSYWLGQEKDQKVGEETDETAITAAISKSAEEKKSTNQSDSKDSNKKTCVRRQPRVDI